MVQGKTDFIMNGTRFLEILSRLGYPEASCLNPSDFDGMFDASSENKEFVNFLCGLGLQNVLSEGELQAYSALEKAGKPLLTEQVLDEMELLKNSADPEEEDEGDEEDELDGRSVAELEQELEELRRQQRVSQKRLQQLQCLRLSRDEHASALAHHTQKRSQREGAEAGDTVKAVARENMATNTALQDLREEVDRLQSLTLMNEDKAEVQQQEQMSLEQRARLPAALLSQLSLEPYLQKAQVTHQCIMDHYKARSALLEERQGMESKVVVVEEDDDKGAVQHAKREMGKLQAAHMLIQGQLLQARAEEAGAIATKEWLCQQKHAVIEPPAPDPDGIPAVEKERVWSVLLRRTQQLCSAVLWGQTREQGELTREYARLQERLLGELLQQKAHLDLLHCGLQWERRGHGCAVSHVSRVAQGLREEVARGAEGATELQRRQENAPQPDPMLSVTDPTVKRLLQMLEASEKTQGWFAGVVDVAAVVSEGQAELRRGGGAESEAVANQQQLMSELEKDSRRLKQWAEPRQSTPGAEAAFHLCPSAQELRRVVQEMEQQSGSLYAQLQEVAAELSSKRSQLDRSATLRAERELYTLFHLDPAALRQAVENQEKRE